MTDEQSTSRLRINQMCHAVESLQSAAGWKLLAAELSAEAETLHDEILTANPATLAANPAILAEHARRLERWQTLQLVLMWPTAKLDELEAEMKGETSCL